LIVILLISVPIFGNAQTFAPGTQLNPCEQLATCLGKYDSIACSNIVPLTVDSASQENILETSEKDTSEAHKLPEAIGTCLKDMRSVLDNLKQKMSARVEFYKKCLIEQSANQTIDTLLADMDPKQIDKCKLASTGVTLDNACVIPVSFPPKPEKAEKDAKKKKKRESDSKKPASEESSEKPPVMPPATTHCDAQKRFLVKKCQTMAKCCPFMETCRLQFELDPIHRDWARLKLNSITQRQKCMAMAKQVNLESSKLDQALGEDIFNENHGIFF